MQAPPPVPELLQRLSLMAVDVKKMLFERRLDWRFRPSPGEWSMTEVVCHLRDVEIEVHQARFKAMVEVVNPFLPGVSADEWAEIRGYQDQDGPAVLEKFLAARDDTLSLLGEIPSSYWTREGRHAFFGPTSMHEILFLVARHDELHLEQIRSILEAQNVK